MVSSTKNRSSKGFSLNLSIPPLSRSLADGLPSSKDSAAARSERSLQSYTPSPSRSSFLSPRSPPLPASLHLKQEQPILPIPLTDGLDPSEKMKLLRKTRKLSRILGEVPIPVSVSSPSPATPEFRFLGVLEEPSLTSASTSASSSPIKTPPPPGIDNKGSLRRSATVGHDRHAQQGSIHRAHSLASMRPSLTIPPAALTVHPSPISPIVFSWPDQLQTIPPSPVSPVDESASGKTRSKRDSSVSSRRGSVASSIFPLEKSPEQVLRARAAKLARQLGDNIPPEVLMRAASPPPPRSPLPSPSVVSFAEASFTIREAPRPRRTSSTRLPKDDRRNRLKRQLSLDLRAFVRVPEPPDPSPSVADRQGFPDLLSTIKRSWGHDEGLVPHATKPDDTEHDGNSLDAAPPADDRDSDADSDWEEGVPGRRTLEMQRALNVRRARKMLQVFGNEPPPSLFQITNIPASATDGGISGARAAAHRRSHSHATTFSLPASTLSVPETHDERRDSAGTVTSSGDNHSPLIFADLNSEPPSHPPSPHPGFAEDEPETPPAFPQVSFSQDIVIDSYPTSPLSVPTLASSSFNSLSVASTISLPPSQAPLTRSQGPLSSPIRESFEPSPPASQTMFLWGSATASVSAPTSPPVTSHTALPEPPSAAHPSDPHFRVRRIRAAKLSRFFGVGLNDIAGMLRNGGTPPSPPAGAAAPEMAASPTSPPLREFRLSSSSDAIPSPTSPVGSTHSPSSIRTSRSGRPVTSAGILTTPSVSISDVPVERKRTLSSGARSQSVSSRVPRRPQTQPPQPSAAGERNRSNSQPEVLSLQHAHNRAFSTTVEVSAESKGPFAFLDARRAGRGKELHMHDVIRELRKIK